MKNTFYKKSIVGTSALLVLVGLASPVFAHPHVWVDVVTDILFTSKGEVSGLRHSWTFDESYSVLAIQGLDKNKDKKLSQNELKPLLTSSIKSLKNWEYFSYIKINGKNAALKDLRKKSIQYKKGRVIMRFDLMMQKPVDAVKNNLRLTVYDRSFYNLMSFAEKDPIWLDKNAPESCGFIIEEAKRGNREAAQVDDSYIESLGENVNYGAQFAEWVQLDCKL